MLSGIQGVSGGEASICGFDVRREMSKIHGIIGICPQFDIVWQELTVVQHMQLYARIKGLPAKEARDIVYTFGHLFQNTFGHLFLKRTF